MQKTIKIHINNLILDWYIGVFDFEYEKPQPVSINIELCVDAPKTALADNYDDVVCYKTIVDSIKKLRDCGHVKLVETLGSLIADICLQDRRVHNVEVQILKMQAIEETQSVGITIHRENKHD